jgi:hypothetical protein
MLKSGCAGLLAIAALLTAQVGVISAQEIKLERLQLKIIDRGRLDPAEADAIVLQVKEKAKPTIRWLIDDGTDKPKVKRIEIDDPAIAAAIEALLKEKDKPAPPKHDGSELNRSLRDVINIGVKMFNEQGDYAGCYRLYQGSLVAVKPFLSPDLQKKIDKGLANAETMRSYADRAYELRRVLDEIRASLPPVAASSVAGEKGQVSGKLAYEGKAVKGGYFVTLVGADGKKFSSAIQKDGSFQFKTAIAPGKYRVAIEPIPGETVKGALPARFTSEETSGIVVMVEAGKSFVDLNLVK